VLFGHFNITALLTGRKLEFSGTLGWEMAKVGPFQLDPVREKEWVHILFGIF